jgi:biopolymer transport protein ExbD
MDLGKLRAIFAPAIASIFVILVLCVFVSRTPQPANGIRIPIYPLQPEANPSGVCNSRPPVVWLSEDGKLWMNNLEVHPRRLRPLIIEMLGSRERQRVYVVANSNLSYGQFAQVLSEVVGAIPNLDLVLLSGDLLREVEREPTFDGLCGLDYLGPSRPLRYISPYAPLRLVPANPAGPF